MLTKPSEEVPVPFPQDVRRINTYGGEATWIGPQHQTGRRVVLLITPKGDSTDDAGALKSLTDTSLLLLAVNPLEDDDTTSACVVACYRWLLAQLVPSSDVVIIALGDLASTLAQAIERLRRSGDALPDSADTIARIDRSGLRSFSRATSLRSMNRLTTTTQRCHPLRRDA